MFGNESWSQLCESAASQDPVQMKPEIQEIVNRIQRYLHTAGPCTQIPIAEAMVNYKDEDSCQIFVPFVSVSIIWSIAFASNVISSRKSNECVNFVSVSVSVCVLLNTGCEIGINGAASIVA